MVTDLALGGMRPGLVQVLRQRPLGAMMPAAHQEGGGRLSAVLALHAIQCLLHDFNRDGVATYRSLEALAGHFHNERDSRLLRRQQL